MKYPRILARVISTRWAILPSAFDGIARALSDGPEMPVVPVTPDENDREAPALRGAIAVITVAGIIGKHLSSLETMCGGCDLDDVEEQFDAAIADPSVSDIVLRFDSPGGTVPGVPELARRMRNRAAEAKKGLYGFTDTLMASAAYWLASVCELVACTPTATVGSIGVYCAFTDYSTALEKEGIKITLVKAGKFKDMGSSHRPMTPEELAIVQGEVDSIWAMFKADVQSGRPGVSADAMEGLTYLGAQSVALGLVDELVQDFDEFLSAIQRHRTTATAPATVDTPATT